MGRNRVAVPRSSGGSATSKSTRGLGWVQIVIGLLVVLLVGLIFRNAASGVENLKGASADELKNVFFGDRPYVFYCGKVNKEDSPPAAFVTLHGELRTKMGFAILDCNQKLPSGKTIKEKFRLKKKGSDKVFVTSPYGPPQQADANIVRDLVLLRRFVKKATAAVGRPVASDAELVKNCGFNSSIPAAEVSPCLILVKGSRFEASHSELEEKIVRGYRSLKVVSIDATAKRLNFEDADKMPADHFAMKLYALKGMKRSLTMIYPMEWENVQSFVANVIRQPLGGFDVVKGGVSIIKAPPKKKFKERIPKPPPGQNEPSSAPTGKPAAEERKAAREEARERILKARASMTEEEKEEDRKRREREVRDRMDREAGDLFEEAGDDDGDESDNEDDDDDDDDRYDEEDEDIIEL